MYSKNIFFKFSFLFALLALCLHAEKLQAQNESVHFKYELVDNGLNILGVSSYWQDVVKGIVILCAVLSEKFMSYYLIYIISQTI